MKVGLFFGSFNPIHVGHLILADHFAQHSDLDQVWLVVSPSNPLKKKSTLLADHHRLAMTRIAVEDNPRLQVSNIEFELEQPSYTLIRCCTCQSNTQIMNSHSLWEKTI